MLERKSDLLIDTTTKKINAPVSPGDGIDQRQCCTTSQRNHTDACWLVGGGSVSSVEHTVSCVKQEDGCLQDVRNDIQDTPVGMSTC